MSNPDYGVFWSVPVEWQNISSNWSTSPRETLFWNAWASEENAPDLLLSPNPTFANGLMVLTIQVEQFEPSASLPPGVATTTGWRQAVWFQEGGGTIAPPFDMRLSYMTVQPPYTYTFAMNCAMPEGNDTHKNESFAALCRHFWDFVSFDFGLCNTPVMADPELLTWQQISDEFYQYAFEIPEQWVQTGGVSPDSFTYLSAAPQHPSCVQSDNTMKMDFSVQPMGNGMPVIEGAMPVTDAELPTWVKTHQSEEGAELPGASKSIYIQGTEYGYNLYLLCFPEWTTYCETVINHILESFHTLP